MLWFILFFIGFVAEEVKSVSISTRTTLEQIDDNTWQISTPSKSIYPNQNQVTLYEHGLRSGNRLEVLLNPGECVALPVNFINSVSWVQSYDNCVELCDLHSCTGECYRIEPTRDENGVGILDYFNDRAESLRLCEVMDNLMANEGMQSDQPVGPSIGFLQANDIREAKVVQLSDHSWQLSTFGNNVKHPVSVYEHGYREGNRLDVFIEAGECLELPHLFNEQVSSLTIHEENVCVKLCKETICSGDCEKYKSNPQENENDGKLFVGDAMNDRASSIILCENEGESPLALPLIWSIPEETYAHKEEYLRTNNSNGELLHITLYEHGYFQGHKLEIYISEADTCMNIPESFDNHTSSVDPHGNCVILCDIANCKGTCKSFGFIEPVSYWVGEDFNDIASSIRPC